jgi:hypothetical protein
MIEQLFILSGYPWYVQLGAVVVAGIIGTGAFFFWYHVIKYPNGRKGK